MHDPHIELVKLAEDLPRVPWLPPPPLELRGRLDSELSCVHTVHELSVPFARGQKGQAKASCDPEFPPQSSAHVSLRCCCFAFLCCGFRLMTRPRLRCQSQLQSQNGAGLKNDLACKVLLQREQTEF